jgi:hypothetical protein
MSNNREIPAAIQDAIKLMLDDHLVHLHSRPWQQTTQHQERSQVRVKAFVIIERYNVDHWGADQWLTPAEITDILEYVNERFDAKYV